MNPTGQPVQLRPNYKILGVLAAVGLVLFLLLQVFPSTASDTLEVQQVNVISQEKAIDSAKAFASDTLVLPDLPAPSVTYHTNAELSGYVAKEKLTQTYMQKLEKVAPYDVFRVHYPDVGTGDALDIDVHMNTGKVVAFSMYDNKTGPAQPFSLDPTATTEKDESITLIEKQEQAQPILKTLGYDAGQLTLQTKGNQQDLLYNATDSKLGDSQLQLKFTYEYGQIRSFQPVLTPPDTYTAYVKEQTTLAGWLTALGYGLFTLVLGVLAIVFGSLKRRHTSFKRGIVLSIIYCAISVFSVLNMWPILVDITLGESNKIVSYVIIGLQLILNVLMAILLYFSFVGGDGLWRERGINIWPRSKELGYGKYVLHSVAVGYLYALILLGVQSIIYLILENALGVYSATDDTSSPYNMIYPALFPLLAWMAGIGEEAVYRLFGIAMLKKIVRNTFVACFITTMIWALGHTLYPIYPVYSRPIELLFIGLLFSFIFLRYGFIAAVFAHVIFDSILMSLSLISMGGIVNILLGAFYIALPAIVAVIIYTFTKNKGVENAYPPYVPPAPIPQAYYDPAQGQQQYPDHPQQFQQYTNQVPPSDHENKPKE